MTREELEEKLDREVFEGKITLAEAGEEWLEFMHRDEVWPEW